MNQIKIVLRALAALAVILPCLAHSQANQDTRLLRYADIHKNSVTFVYAGDIYVADINSGESQRLTDHIGFEAFPKFSPDGSQIAFSAEYNGSRQVYVMNSDGSSSKQLTFYNDVGPMPPRGGFDYRILDWTPDGQHIVFRANRLPYGQRMGKPYKISVDGGMETPLAVPETGGGMLSTDGSKFIYTPIDREFRTWKRTRGGRAQDVWMYDLENNISKQLTDHRATDHQPTVVGDDIFFVSDRDYTLNLYQYQEASEPTKLTHHQDFDVLWPSAGPDAIVYENGGYLYRFDPASKQSTKLTINIAGVRQFAQASSQNVSEFIDSMSIDNSGKRALFAARGELFSVPKKNGVTRNLSHTPKSREISASWSPNGRYIAYLSDKSGEYEIYIRDRSANNEIKQLSSDSSIWLFEPVWSSDSKHLLYADKNHTLWLLSIDNKKRAKIDVAKYDENGLTQYLFSPNSQDIIYVKNNENRYSSLWHYNIKSKQSMRLTDNMTSESNPTFSPNGHYLYFSSQRDFNLTFGAYEFDFLHTDATRIYGVAVNDSVLAINKFMSDEVVLGEQDDGNDKKKAKKDKDIDTSIQAKNFKQRVEVLNAKAGNYFALNGIEGGVLAMSGDTLHIVESGREGKVKTLAENINDYVISENRKHLLVKSGDTFSIVEPKEKQDLSENQLTLSQMMLKIDPKTEWAQMYREAWRTLRDWFYDENHHGQNWEDILVKYQGMADAVAHRSDLDYIFGEIAGELNAGHIYVQSGDAPSAPRKKHGLLGGEFSKHKSGYFRIDAIFEGENWHEEFRSPLDEPGVKASVGNYVIAIQGKATSSVNNLFELLENTQGQIIEVQLSESPNSKNTWTAIVKPVASELGLRYRQWVQSRVDYVNELSGGRIGYVHLPNTHTAGHRELFKTFMPQTTKDALIIDDRYNGGGFIPEHMIAWLGRKPLNYWKRRGVEPTKTPQLAHDGPKAMLINGYSSSGGDALPYYFRQAGLGKIIGTRTWGGLIGISGNPSLVDGGQVIAATFRILDTEGNWIIENEGVEPDIEVVDRPELIFKGQDPSIERAVEELLKELEQSPKKQWEVPPAPSEF